VKDQPLVSVIIPTFGRAQKLGRAIDSVIIQSYLNIEIIVVDDNHPYSIDRINTENLITKKYCNKVLYIKNDMNMGGAFSRNIGARLSKGDLLTFLDDDDFYHIDKVEVQVKHILNERLDVSLCAAEITMDDKPLKGYDCYPHGTCLVDFIKFGAAVTPMIMLKKKIFLDVGGFENTPRFQDHVFMIKVHEANAVVGIIKEKLYTQVIHDGPRISYSKKSKIGYEIKHDFERRNFVFLNETEIEKINFRQGIELLPFLKEEKGVLPTLYSILSMFLSVKSLKDIIILIKSFVKAIIRK
jgi:glycosyltransferase involved in cell wall biosynthesis